MPLAMTVPEAAADPRLRRFPLRRLRLPVAGGNLDLVTVDVDAWHRRGGGVEAILRGEEPPYWAQAWPASVAAARLLCRHGGFAGRTAVDLGCGLGLAGAAAARGGASVQCLDLHEPALAFAEFNGRRNAQAGGTVTARCFDWSRDPAPAADLWLLCDVTYRPRYHDSVLRQLTEGLGHGALAIHCDPFRVESESFVRRAADEFTVQIHRVDTHHAGERVPIRVALIARTAEPLASWSRLLVPPADGARPA